MENGEIKDFIVRLMKIFIEENQNLTSMFLKTLRQTQTGVKGFFETLWFYLKTGARDEKKNCS